MSGERVFRDKDGDLWAEAALAGHGQRSLVSLDDKTLQRVADKFGSFDQAEIEINYGPLTELVPNADA